MKNKLGCLFYPLVIVAGIAILSLIIILATDDPESEKFTVADTETYKIDYAMNSEQTLFFDVENKTDNLYLIELIDATSGGQALKSNAVEGGEMVSDEYEAATNGVDTHLQNETAEQTEARMSIMVQSEVARPARTDEAITYSLKTKDDEAMNDLINNEVTGTLIIRIYDTETGEIEEVGRHEFTKPEAVDGQI